MYAYNLCVRARTHAHNVLLINVILFVTKFQLSKCLLTCLPGNFGSWFEAKKRAVQNIAPWHIRRKLWMCDNFYPEWSGICLHFGYF